MDLQQLSLFSVLIKCTLLVIAIVVIGTIVTYVYLVVIRLKSDRDNRIWQKYEPQFRVLFINDIIGDENSARPRFLDAIQKFKEFELKSSSIRRMLKREILHFTGQFTGPMRRHLREVYEALGLQSDAKANLKSSNVKKVIMAVKELLDMGIYDARINTAAFLKHRNQYVREISRRYVISLEHDGISRVFDTLTEPISGMEQIELFEAITSQDISSVPDFSRWIHVGYDSSLVIICLKLSAHFQQYDSVSSIEELLESDKDELKKEAVNSLGKLRQPSSENKLVSIYDHQKNNVKAEILKAIGLIRSGTRLNFLKYVYDKESSVELKKCAARSISKHNVKGSFLFANIYYNASEENKVILNHAANTDILY